MRALVPLCLVALASCSSSTARRGSAPEAPVGAAPPARATAEPSVAARAQAAPEPGQGALVDPRTLETIMVCWFERPYEHMFDGSSVQVGNSSVGMLMAGIGGILHYGALNECAGWVAGRAPRSYSDDEPIAVLAGLPLHSPEMREGQPFGFYNPALVDWGRRNLLPAAQASVAGLPVQLVYDRVFSRFFRMMAEAYLHLVDRGVYRREMDLYWQMATAGTEDGIDWLQARYGQALPRYAVGQDGTSMTPQMAIGFWLRRGIDGSAPELWAALRELMGRFDPSFYAGLRGSYASPGIEW